ncbi:MAG: protein-export chaperone SecB [Chitinivorax sp.]
MSDQQPVFNIEKIYVKDLSLEIPHAPAIFLEREQPQIDMQLHNEATKIDEGYFEASITITVTAKLGDKTMFLAEATQAGIFQIRNVPAEDMDPVLGIGCPNILFPYVRETISDMVNRSGFPPVILSPINFEALYAQKQAADAGQAQTH